MSTEQSGPNEQTIREYFERLGWTVTKLPTGKGGQAADFRICQNRNCFLCEVKTVESVRANFPYTALEYYQGQRKKRKDQVERWLAEDPDTNLVWRREEWEFLYAEESEFDRKHRHRRRNAEHSFRGFAQAMQEYFATSTVKDLPYTLRLDSQDLYTPTSDERESFFRWLEAEIHAIDRRELSWHWCAQRWAESAVYYSASYQIHHPNHPNDTKAEYQLSLIGPGGDGPLEVHVYSYGTLNLDRVVSNVEGGLRQLESSTSREEDQEIPRVIALAFKSGIGLEWELLSSCIADLLKEHPVLSAIAVLRWTFEEDLPSQKDDISAWIRFYPTKPAVPTFVVYHNSWLHSARPLPTGAFSDKWSIQCCPIKS